MTDVQDKQTGKKAGKLWHIKDRIIATVLLILTVVVLVIVTVNSINTVSQLNQNGRDLMLGEAGNNAKLIDEWLKKQGTSVELMKVTLEKSDYKDTASIENYLEECLGKNKRCNVPRTESAGYGRDVPY